MLYQRLSGGRPAGNNVQHARGKSGFKAKLTETERGQGSVFSGFEYHAVAAGERWSKLPTRQQQREVPRDNRAYHAYRLAQRVGKGIVKRVYRLAVDLGGPSSVIAEHVRHHGHIHVARLKDRLAVVEGFQLRQLVNVLFNQVADAPQNPAPFAGRHLAPRPGYIIKRLARSRDRLINVLSACLRDLREHFASCRIYRVKRFSRACVPLSV